MLVASSKGWELALTWKKKELSSTSSGTPSQSGTMFRSWPAASVHYVLPNQDFLVACFTEVRAARNHVSAVPSNQLASKRT
jgi:hypothetical protein